MSWEATIGLEIHAQLRTRTKLFCGCSTHYGREPNSQVCPICLGHPGVLPRINRQAVALAVRTGLAVGARIHPVSIFARKNYFYPDLPKNYQITQYRDPLCEGGAVRIDLEGRSRGVGLRRVHLEEDAGKSRHCEQGDLAWRIDLNRCGVPLVEVVSKPEIADPAEASAFVTSIRRLLVWIDVCDGNMEEGSLRCDANVSLRRSGDRQYGTRTEVKNLNSIRFLRRALRHEIDRQQDLLESGAEVVQETRLWDEENGRTVTMRSKEEAHDYRYFPEPDLPPLVVEQDWVESIRRDLPELPDERIERLIAETRLPRADLIRLTATREMADYYETVIAAGADPKLAANWVLGELAGRLSQQGRAFRDPGLPAEAFASLIRSISSGRLSGRQAKKVLAEGIEGKEEPEELIRRLGLEQISDPARITGWIDEVLGGHPERVSAFHAGRTSLLHHFIGEVMKRSGGKANPEILGRLLRARLEQRRLR